MDGDYPLVEVVWLDAWADADEMELDDFDASCQVRTVGYLVRDGAVVSVAQEVLAAKKGGAETFRSTTHIPRAMVARVNRLERRASEATTNLG
jgi:hypothetical protein